MNNTGNGWFLKGHKTNVGFRHSNETKLLISKKLKGRVLSRGGIGKRTDEFKSACRERMLRKFKDDDYRSKVMNALDKAHKACKGIKRSEEVKRRISETLKKQRYTGMPKDYPEQFNATLKAIIKARDFNTCQLCHINEEEHKLVFKAGLSVHHINYNKFDCSQDNLVTVCKACNARVNFNKKKWIEWFSFGVPFVFGRFDGNVPRNENGDRMLSEKCKEYSWR